MTFDQYQDETQRTSSNDVSLIVCALGLCGESGEIADHIKKAVAQGHELDTEKIAYELGDICWYISQAARAIDMKLSDVIDMNVEKLRKRYPNGFEAERSIHRGE
jgi:NTP pyrophosphatase (non-canonical NTP hydrolase)